MTSSILRLLLLWGLADAAHATSAITAGQPGSAATPGATAEPGALPAAVEAFLRAPLATFRRERVPRSFRIIALSNLADYCAGAREQGAITEDAARRCLTEVAAIALDRPVRPYGEPVATAALGGHGLYLSHLGIVLANHARVVGDGRHAAPLRRVVGHLRALSLGDPRANAPSYPGVAVRFPADQAATLYALWLFDETEGTDLAPAPIAAWLAFLREHGESDWPGLPVSELSGRTRTSKLPRGCALSFTVRYMAAFAPAEAARLWAVYRESFLVDAGFAAALREWPPGVDRAADVDSGPIVMGLGAAATGLGLGAARAVGDEETYQRLKGSEAIVRALGGEAAAAVGNSILALSIAQSAEVQRPRAHAAEP